MVNGTDYDVVSVGETLIDFVAPEAENLAGAEIFIRAAGGAPANVAVASARLGARTLMVSAVGRDPFGTYMRSILESNGVDVSAMLTVPERTTLAFVAKNTGGIPDFVFYRGSDTVLKPEDIPIEAIRRSGFVHVSSMALMTEPSGSATRAAAEAAHGAHTLVSFDPNLRPSSWPSVDAIRDAVLPLVPQTDVLKINDEEARLLTGQDDLEAAAQSLGRPDALVVITLGPEGCLWRWKGQVGRIAAPRVQVVETTGAGDAFVGAMLAELCRTGYIGERFAELDLPALVRVLQMATAAGALACTTAGAMASLPTGNELEQFMAGYAAAS